MNYIDDIMKDEIRDGFLVTTDRKKAWNKMIQILMVIDNICKKYSIKYFAEGGTLIGAARHKGFIPWDDDLDISMLRPDYDKFLKVAEKEIDYPLVLSTAYNSGDILSISKLMDVETTAIEDINDKRPQGIFIDIWPLDDIPDDAERNKAIWDIRQSMLAAINNPQGTLDSMNQGVMFKPSNDFIKEYIKLPDIQRFKEYEKFSSKHFGESENVGYPLSKIMGIKGNLKRSYYRETVYLSFENVQIPVPIEYEKVLVAEYGDWHKLIRAKSFHELEYMTDDISYRDIIKHINHNISNIEQ